MDRAAPKSMVGRVTEYRNLIEPSHDSSLTEAHAATGETLDPVAGALSSEQAVHGLADMLGLSGEDGLDEW